MTIWTYGDAQHHVTWQLVRRAACAFCRTPLTTFADHLGESSFQSPRYYQRGGLWLAPRVSTWDSGQTVSACNTCGWWTMWRSEEHRMREAGPESGQRVLRGAAGVLRQLDMADITLPLSEVRSYLIVKYADRLSVDPRLFELVVRDVFRDLGWRAYATAYSGDQGVDVVLQGPNELLVGVQVKRWKNSIKVGQIREFAGALLLEGFTRGVFVTTSDFQSGCAPTATQAAFIGTPVELINADQFYEMLRIAQRPAYSSFEDEDAPWHGVELATISSSEVGTA